MVMADAPPAFTEVGLRYTRYSEDSLDDNKLLFGSRDRYDIDVTQLWIEAPLGANWSVALDVKTTIKLARHLGLWEHRSMVSLVSS